MKQLAALALALLLLAALLASPVSAHDVRPALLALREAPRGQWQVTWKQPVMAGTVARLAPHLSNGWIDRAPDAETVTSRYRERTWHVRSTAPVDGITARIDGLPATITEVLLTVHTAAGGDFETILRPDRPAVPIAFARHDGLAIPAYLRLGVTHILTGADHLAFVLGPVLLVGLNRRLVWAVTAFTLAHSLTLGASALGWVHAPSATNEALVALSIVFVARELAVSRDRQGLTAQAPWLIAFAFGLLHGFAFAGALAEVGLPQDAIPLALLLFNLGVEAGQLLFIGAVMLLLLALRRGLPQLSRNKAATARRLTAYAMGCLAAALFIGRAAAAFA